MYCVPLSRNADWQQTGKVAEGAWGSRSLGLFVLRALDSTTNYVRLHSTHATSPHFQSRQGPHSRLQGFMLHASCFMLHASVYQATTATTTTTSHAATVATCL